MSVALAGLSLAALGVGLAAVAAFGARLGALAARERLLAACGVWIAALVSLAALAVASGRAEIWDAALALGLFGAAGLFAGLKAARARTLQGPFGPPPTPRGSEAP